jgi:RNA polymerase beta subunit
MSTGIPVEQDNDVTMDSLVGQSSVDNQVLWRIIHRHFQDNPRHLVAHHIESYNDFFKTEIFNIFRDNNPVTIVSGQKETGESKHKCLLYLGGKDGKRIYFGKPVIQDHDRMHYMYPNEARLRNMTYAMTVHYDVEVEFIDRIDEGEAPYEMGTEFLGEGGAAVDYEHAEDYTVEPAFSNYKLGGGHDILLSNQLLSDNSPKLAEVTNGGIPFAFGGAKRAAKKPGKLSPEVAATLRNINEKSMIDATTQKRTILLEKIY